MTNAELAILGLIVERPLHGYAIEQTIEERGMRDWTEVGFSSIYYILNKLEKDSLITSRLEKTPGRGPARKVYEITAKGRSVWLQASLNALTQPGTPNSSLLLGLVGLPAIPSGQAIAALQQYRGHLAERRERLQVNWQAAGGGLPLFLEGMFEYGYRLVETEIEWLEEFIGKLEAQKRKENDHGKSDH